MMRCCCIVQDLRLIRTPHLSASSPSIPSGSPSPRTDAPKPASDPHIACASSPSRYPSQGFEKKALIEQSQPLPSEFSALIARLPSPVDPSYSWTVRQASCPHSSPLLREWSAPPGEGSLR